MMLTLSVAFHVVAAVIWVGGMFFALIVLRPSTGPLDLGVRRVQPNRDLRAHHDGGRDPDDADLRTPLFRAVATLPPRGRRRGMADGRNPHRPDSIVGNHQ